MLIDLLIKNLNQLRFIKREKVNNTIIFINIIIKKRFNNNYKIINFREEA